MSCYNYLESLKTLIIPTNSSSCSVIYTNTPSPSLASWCALVLWSPQARSALLKNVLPPVSFKMAPLQFHPEVPCFCISNKPKTTRTSCVASSLWSFLILDTLPSHLWLSSLMPGTKNKPLSKKNQIPVWFQIKIIIKENQTTKPNRRATLKWSSCFPDQDTVDLLTHFLLLPSAIPPSPFPCFAWKLSHSSTR